MVIKSELNHAEDLLCAGALVAMPTETVYGLAANAFNDAAVLKVFELKKRPHFDPLIVHLATKPESFRGGWVDYLSEFGIVDRHKVFELGISESIERLASKFWPGPLTLVLPKSDRISDLVTSGLDTVAVRIPDHRIAQGLLSRLDFPLAAPSANRFGKVSPTEAQHVRDEFGEDAPFVLDGGACNLGIESTVLLLSAGEGGKPAAAILRHGGISQAELEQALQAKFSTSTSQMMRSPGHLDQHYAPNVKAILLQAPVRELQPDEITQIILNHMAPNPNLSRVGLLLYKQDLNQKILPPESPVLYLTETGNVREAAFQLFRKLREFNSKNIDLLLIEPPHTREGLGEAIFDRLKRASAS